MPKSKWITVSRSGALPFSGRVVLNRAKLAEVQLAVADGTANLLAEIARDAAANVVLGADPRYGHIRYQWGHATYVDGKKVGEDSYDGSVTNKPRAFKAGLGLSGIVGFGFPARFHEVGTSDTAAYPFLTPAAQRIVPRATGIVKAGAARRLSQP